MSGFRPYDPEYPICAAARADTWISFRVGWETSYGPGEMGGRELATVTRALVDRGGVSRTVADAGNSQQVRRRLCQEHRTQEGAAPYKFELPASTRSPDDVQHDLLLALGLLNGGAFAELRQPIERQCLCALSIAMEESKRQQWRSGD